MVHVLPLHCSSKLDVHEGFMLNELFLFFQPLFLNIDSFWKMLFSFDFRALRSGLCFSNGRYATS